MQELEDVKRNSAVLADRIVAAVEASIVRVEAKIDHLADRIGSIDITSARHEENLLEHMRRTELLEQRDEEIAAALLPITQHVDRVKFVGIIIAAVMSVVGLAVGIASYFK